MKKHLSIAALVLATLATGRAELASGAWSAAEDGAIGRHKVLVIAHRGASGYLPEHTIAAKAMAYGQGADYIEQDLVMTRDDQLVVMHDIYLDTVTDVAEAFPDRAREDGRFYVIDFDLAEIRQLSVSERFGVDEGDRIAVFPERFPLGKSKFSVHTFADEIELVQGLNRSTGREVGIYPEMKAPSFHSAEGKDIAKATLKVLKAYGYETVEDTVFLQCFEPDALQRIRQELMPEMEMDLRLVQLIGTSPKFEPYLDEAGMKAIAAYADGVGPSMTLLIDVKSDDLRRTGLLAAARAAGLLVHPYTFRRERDQMPKLVDTYDALLAVFIDELGVDGVFTDFPDLTVSYIESQR